MAGQRMGDILKTVLRQWYRTAGDECVKVIRDHWLAGPRPERLGVKTGNLRASVIRKVTPNGFIVGTNVKYGKYWEEGFQRRGRKARGNKPARAGARVQPRKWLEPGVNDAMPELLHLCERELTARLNKAAKVTVEVRL